MTEAEPRSPRAEKARDWFWTSFGIAALFNLGVHIFEMDFLTHGWGLTPRIVVTLVWLVAGAIWAWETLQRARA